MHRKGFSSICFMFNSASLTDQKADMTSRLDKRRDLGVEDFINIPKITILPSIILEKQDKYDPRRKSQIPIMMSFVSKTFASSQ